MRLYKEAGIYTNNKQLKEMSCGEQIQLYIERDFVVFNWNITRIVRGRILVMKTNWHGMILRFCKRLFVVHLNT
jgi:hypothetical protein